MANTADQASAPLSDADSSGLARRNIVVAVTNFEDLFNSPTVNPLTDRDLRALGEPALSRAVRELQADGLRDRRPVRLRIVLLADQYTPDNGASQLADAIHRYCAAKIADNTETIHLMRRRARRGLQIAVVMVLTFTALAYALLTTLLAHAGPVIQAIVVGSLSVFTWVVLWDTLEAWIFNPVPLSFENRAFGKLREADVVVEVSAE